MLLERVAAGGSQFDGLADGDAAMLANEFDDSMFFSSQIGSFIAAQNTANNLRMRRIGLIITA